MKKVLLFCLLAIFGLSLPVSVKATPDSVWLVSITPLSNSSVRFTIGYSGPSTERWIRVNFGNVTFGVNEFNTLSYFAAGNSGTLVIDQFSNLNPGAWYYAKAFEHWPQITDSEVWTFQMVYTNPCQNFHVSINCSQVEFCEGGQTTLSVNTINQCTAFLWNTGSTSSSITVSTSGVYSVTVTDVNGCTATSQVIVTVYPKPQIFILSAQGAGMTGNKDFLSVQVLNPGDYQYQWSNQMNGPSVVVTSEGLYSVTVTDKDTWCSSTASINVHFNECATGDTVVLHHYDIDTVLVVETITVEVPVYIPYPVEVHDTTYIVHCPEGITASYNNGVVCTGDYLFLSAPFADSYEWGEEVVDKNYIVDTDNPGITTYTCTTTTNGIHTTYYFTVYVYAPMPKPVIATVGGETVFCDSTYLSSDQVAPHFQYQWYRNGVSLFGETGPVVKIGVSGDYSVKVTTPCGTQTSNVNWITIANCGTTGGVDGDEEDDFNVYPNPSNGVFYVDMPNDTGLQYILYDINEKVILQEIAENDFEVEVLHLPAGTYVLQIITDNAELFMKQIVIQ